MKSNTLIDDETKAQLIKFQTELMLYGVAYCAYYIENDEVKIKILNQTDVIFNVNPTEFDSNSRTNE